MNICLFVEECIRIFTSVKNAGMIRSISITPNGWRYGIVIFSITKLNLKIWLTIFMDKT